MYPKILQFGNFNGISTFQLMIFFGVIAFYLTFRLTCKAEGIGKITRARLFSVCLFGIAVLGASAFFFNSLFHTIENKKLSIGGITWLGGVVVAFPVTILLIHKLVPKAKGRALYYFSLLIPGIVIGHAFGRMGCFLGGCCYGGVTDSIFGVSFPEGSSAAHVYPAVSGRSLKVFPTQLFECVFELLLFIVMMLSRKKTKGYNIEIYAVSYGIFRFLIEFLRGDNRGATGIGVTPSQLLSILLIISAFFLILFRKGYIFKRLNEKCKVWQVEADALDDRDGVYEIQRLYALYKKGVITEEEYNEKKKEMLNKL